MKMYSCYDCIHCEACSDAGDSGFSYLKDDVSKCKHFANKADFVEVVWCKDCRYFDKGFINNNGFFVCPASGMEITENDFCSYGERRKDDVDE